MIHASTSFPTSSCIAWFLSAACPLFVCLTEEHPSRMFKRCSTICLRTPVISAGFQAKISKLRWSRPHNLLLPPSVRVEPIITACSGYSGSIATLTLSSNIGLVAGRVSSGPKTNAHSSGTNILLFRPHNSASMIIGPSVPSSSSKSRKKISVFGKKLCVIFCLATLSQGWTSTMANALSFLKVSPFFAALGCSFPLFCLSSFIKRNSFPALIISSICFFRIRYFDFPRTRMPSHIKTYDGSEDPEDHLKIFQAAAKTERWAMPIWCHMFNSTLTGNARVWFYDLPTESIDNYDDLKKAFMENYLQQKKCIKDPIELHNIKQRDGKST
nr:reverse transcriptase domain-containing protein [Tanacetum cinerariifolium]